MSEEIKNEAVAEGISKSKAKREARKAEVKSEKTKKNFDKILGWIIGVVIAGVVIAAIGMGIYSSVNKTTSANTYSAQLTDEGYIKGANLNKVKDLGFENLVVPFSEVEYTDDDVENDIQSALSNTKYYDDDASLTVADGDTINLDYTGSIDGVEFEGGAATGASLTIGSNTFIDDFEEQLIGSHPGDAVTVTVNFPETYDNNPDLAGKEAVFECVVNSIQVTPEFTDEWVVENYGDLASTTDELRAYAKEQGYKSNLYSYITNYINDNAEVSSLPSAYVKNLKSVLKYSDEQTYNYYNQYYYAYLGSYLYDSFESYTGMTDEEYEKKLKEDAKKQAAVDMTYESLFKNYGLTISEELYNETVGTISSTEDYGAGYLNQICIKYAVVEHLADIVTVQ